VPANGRSTPTRRARGLRLVASGLTLVFLLSVGAGSPTPATATNWTRQISATRASQIYYESAMRSADGQLKSLKRARKQTQRQLKKAKRNLSRAKSRRSAVSVRVEQTWSRLRLARVAHEAEQQALAITNSAAAILALAGLVAATDQDTDELADEGARQEHGLLAFGVTGTTAETQPAVTAEDMPRLEKQLEKQKKTLKKTKKKVRRVARNKRAKARSLATIKRQRTATIARRESAEAGLASRILSMSRLAQRRVAKKTNIRPGINSGFSWPTRGRISQGYGCTGYYLNPPRGSCRHFHDGLDIAGYRGTPIRSAAIGVVSYVGWNPWDQEGRAFMIVVAHPGGYETLYGHVLSTRRVRVGQLVKKGQVIGYMGNTGRSTGVHLHLELRRGRTTLNPLAFL